MSSNQQTAPGELDFTRVFEAPRELVFRCMIDPRHLTHFWGPVGVSAPVDRIRVDPRPGGVFETVMVNDADGSEYPTKATYLEVTEPERLVWREEYSGMTVTATAGHAPPERAEPLETTRRRPSRRADPRRHPRPGHHRRPRPRPPGPGRAPAHRPAHDHHPEKPQALRPGLTGIELRATDIDWSFGSGAPLSGPAQDLALALCARKLPTGSKAPRPAPRPPGRPLHRQPALNRTRTTPEGLLWLLATLTIRRTTCT
jgi:uncharacterized protein YndB with AHSA1/START domain